MQFYFLLMNTKSENDIKKHEQNIRENGGKVVHDLEGSDPIYVVLPASIETYPESDFHKELGINMSAQMVREKPVQVVSNKRRMTALLSSVC